MNVYKFFMKGPYGSVEFYEDDLKDIVWEEDEDGCWESFDDVPCTDINENDEPTFYDFRVCGNDLFVGGMCVESIILANGPRKPIKDWKKLLNVPEDMEESRRRPGRMLREGREEDLSYLGDAFSKFVNYIRRAARNVAPANWSIVWHEDEDTIPEYYRDNRDFVAGLDALKTDEISCGWDNYIIASAKLTKDDLFLAIWGVEIAERLENLNIFIAKEMRALYGKHFRLSDLKKNDIDKSSLREISNIVEDFTKETIERFPEVKTESRRPRGQMLREETEYVRGNEWTIANLNYKSGYLEALKFVANVTENYDDMDEFRVWINRAITNAKKELSEAGESRRPRGRVLRESRRTRRLNEEHRKVNQRELRQMVGDGFAEDITDIGFEGAKRLKEKEGYLDVVGTGSGVYGVNCAWLQGAKTGTHYVVTARNSTLLSLV